jgi:hypothetical protein
MSVNVDLGQNPTTTIDTGNVGDGNIDLTLGSNGTLIFNGVTADIVDISGNNIVSNTTIEAINGANVTIGNNVAAVNAGSSMTYDIGANSTITENLGVANVGLLNNTTINFENTGGTGEFVVSPSGVNVNLSTNPVINGLSNGDKIEVVGATAATLSGSVLTFTYPVLGIPTTMSFTLDNIPAGSTVSFSPTTGIATFACFLRGTNIWTLHGYVPVENLKAGQEVFTLKRGRSRIKWVGRRIIDPRTLADPADALPVRIARGAMGEDSPRRDLFLSPDHSIYYDHSLIPVKLLINGSSIAQEGRDEPFEYFHIELDRHDVIAVEGVLAETYLDLGNREMFAGPGVVQFVPTAKATWSDYAFPPVYAGTIFDRLQSGLMARAKILARREIGASELHADEIRQWGASGKIAV